MKTDRLAPTVPSMVSLGSRAGQVLIAGGGPAALETALALQRLAGDRVAITLLAPDIELVYRPLSVAEPFGGAAPRSFSVAALAADRGFGLRRDAVAAVDPDARLVTTVADATLGYDALVLAIGAEPVEAVPGAVTFRGTADSSRVHRRLLQALQRPAPRVAFVAAPSTAWTLPIYEMALLSVGWAAERGAALEPWVVTHEPRPLEVFGRQASIDVAELLEQAGVRLWTGAEAEAVEDGRLWLAMEGGLPVELALALPRPLGRPVAGLPRDELGFTPVDAFGRVPGAPDVYAIGDMTTRPLKQGGLATQQADATASALAAWAGADVDPAPYHPELRAVMLTGGAPRFLHRLAGRADGRSQVSDEPPWWPPHKIAARHLSPYLAAHPELEVHRTGTEQRE